MQGIDLAPHERLEPGTSIEVRNGFDGTWSRGFTVADVDETNGVQVRRAADGTLLPRRFGWDRVRPAA
jgi:hypothetical protein